MPAGDGYEDLSQKVMKSSLAIRCLFGSVAVLKIDDDARVAGPNQPAIDHLLANVDYAGVMVGHSLFDRCWHVGKCHDPGELPYAKRLSGVWANGSLSFVRVRRHWILSLESFCSGPGETSAEIFEDKLVGDILRRANVQLTPMNLSGLLGIELFEEHDIEPSQVSFT